MSVVPSSTLPPPPRTARPPDLPGGPGDPHDGGGGDSRDDDREPVRWVTLACFMHAAEAHIARLRLESAGVACVLLDEHMGGTQCLSLAVGGVKLQVPAGEAERALELLRRLCPGAVAPEPPLAVAGDRATATMIACVAEAAGSACDVEETGGVWTVHARPQWSVPEAAGAVARTRFAPHLTAAGLAALGRQSCPSCGSRQSRPDLSPPLAIGPLRPLRAAAARLLSRRRCRECGTRFGR